jgi:hypothetical protein
MAGIHDSTDLMTIFGGCTDSDAAAVLKRQLNDVEQQGLKVSTVSLLREETVRHLNHANSIYFGTVWKSNLVMMSNWKCFQK